MKNILVISPQHWSHIAVSKHHYATELARDAECRVYYLCPPFPVGSKQFSITPSGVLSNLYIVEYSYSFRFPLFLRYKFSFLYDYLMRQWVTKTLLSHIPSFYEVWCFDGNVFQNLSWFKAKRTFFFQVDAFDEKRASAIAKNADVVVTVSEMLMQPFNLLMARKFIINHGLALHFQKRAEHDLTTLTSIHQTTSEIINAGFFGNLKVPQIDRDLYIEVINQNPKVVFHFWGTYEIDTNEKVSVDVERFIKFLKSKSNVKLYGPVTTEVLCSEIRSVDLFIFCYNMNHQNKGNNSHKLIEALSTGKVIVSNYFPVLRAFEHMAVMPSDFSNDQLPELFEMTVSNLSFYNSKELRKKRIEFAIQNSYGYHIKTLRQNVLVAKSLTPVNLTV